MSQLGDIFRFRYMIMKSNGYFFGVKRFARFRYLDVCAMKHALARESGPHTTECQVDGLLATIVKSYWQKFSQSCYDIIRFILCWFPLHCIMIMRATRMLHTCMNSLWLYSCCIFIGMSSFRRWSNAKFIVIAVRLNYVVPDIILDFNVKFYD